jgi:hypothetical protein
MPTTANSVTNEGESSTDHRTAAVLGGYGLAYCTPKPPDGHLIPRSDALMDDAWIVHRARYDAWLLLDDTLHRGPEGPVKLRDSAVV